MQEAANPSLILAMLIGAALSLAALFALFRRHILGQPLLGYELRRSVPWGVMAMLPALMLVVLKLASVLIETKEADPEQFVQQLWISSAITVSVFLLGLGWLRVVCNASPKDLGFPSSGNQALADVFSGAVACCASLLPVYLLLIVLKLVFRPEQEHPLIEQLLAQRTPAMMLAAVATAVIAAPLFEEFIFRLLLQGALERWEDKQLGFIATPPPETVLTPEDIPEDSQPGVRSLPAMVAPEPPSSDNPYASPSTTSPPPPTAILPERPTQGLLPGLPHGWLPILLSGLLFGLAHFSHGIDPIPLFLFGIVLGYLYQRTHRLLPSIIAHMLFNAFSMFQLWLSFE